MKITFSTSEARPCAFLTPGMQKKSCDIFRISRILWTLRKEKTVQRSIFFGLVSNSFSLVLLSSLKALMDLKM